MPRGWFVRVTGVLFFVVLPPAILPQAVAAQEQIEAQQPVGAFPIRGSRRGFRYLQPRVPGPPQAVPSARIALHARSAPAKNPCSVAPNSTNTPCSAYTTQWPLGSPAYVYMTAVVADSLSGVRGISCGIDYEGGSGFGLDPAMITWTQCSDGLEFPNGGMNGAWPQPGGGNRITWLTCQSQLLAPDGVHAIAGFFYCYAYSASRLQVTRNKNIQSGAEAVMVDCNGIAGQIDSLRLGSVGFGKPGYNPCIDVVGCPGCPDDPPGCNDGVTSVQTLVTECASCDTLLPPQGELPLEASFLKEPKAPIEIQIPIVFIATAVGWFNDYVVPYVELVTYREPQIEPSVEIVSVVARQQDAYVGDILTYDVVIDADFGAVTPNPDGWDDFGHKSFIRTSQTWLKLLLSSEDAEIGAMILHDGTKPYSGTQTGGNILGNKRFKRLKFPISVEVIGVGILPLTLKAELNGGWRSPMGAITKGASDERPLGYQGKDPFEEPQEKPLFQTFQNEGHTHGDSYTMDLEIKYNSTAPGAVMAPRLEYNPGQPAHTVQTSVKVLPLPVPGSAPVFQTLVNDAQLAHLLYPDTQHTVECHYCVRKTYDARVVHLRNGFRVPTDILGERRTIKLWKAGAYLRGGCGTCNGSVGPTGVPGEGEKQKVSLSAGADRPWKPSSSDDLRRQLFPVSTAINWTRTISHDMGDSLVTSPGGDSIFVMKQGESDPTLVFSDGSGQFTFSGSVADTSSVFIRSSDPDLDPVWYMMDAPGLYEVVPDTILLLGRLGPSVKGGVRSDLGAPLSALLYWISGDGDTLVAGGTDGQFSLPPVQTRRLLPGTPRLLIKLVDPDAICASVDTQSVPITIGPDSVDVGIITFTAGSELSQVVVSGIAASYDSSSYTLLPGLTLVVRDPITGVKYTEVTSGQDGRYQFTISPGEWNVSLSNALYLGYCWPTLGQTIYIPGCADTVEFSTFLEDAECDSLPTGIGDEKPLESEVGIWPNPSRSGFSIRMDPRVGRAQVDVYDVAGRHVATVGGSAGDGGQVVRWEGLDERGGRVPPGIYFIRVQSEDRVGSRRVVLLR